MSEPAAPTRIVLVVRTGLPINVATNAAAVLGLTIGTRLGLPTGADAQDAAGITYPGIVTTPVPVLVAEPATLNDLFRRTAGDDTIHVACLTEVARHARTYQAYLDDTAGTTDAATDIVGICLAGPRNRVTRLTRRLALLGDRSSE